MSKYLTYSIIGAGVVFIALASWFFFFRSSPQPSTTPLLPGFGVGDERNVVVPTTGSPNTPNSTQPLGSTTAQMIFKVADGPVTTATLVQTLHPTTTLARYVLQENGHVFDLVLDSAGAVPRALSNTTIPGAVHGVWAQTGNSVILQYFDAGVTKSVYLGFPLATTTASTSPTLPVQIRFLPDNIFSLASSPDGKNVVYLLSTPSGTDGYTAKSDGTGSKKLFSLPLSQVLISWPSSTMGLVWTKSATDIPGAAFSVNVQTGDVVPLLYAPGLTVGADKTFTHVIYQSTSGGRALSYVHTIKTGVESTLSFEPSPERCVWSTSAASTMYCATPLESAPANYLDLWHKGLASAADVIISFNLSSGGSEIIATSGTIDGGVSSDIAEMSISPDDHYLLFIKKGDRSLWAVRLTR